MKWSSEDISANGADQNARYRHIFIINSQNLRTQALDFAEAEF